MAEETNAEKLERLRSQYGVGMSGADRARLLAQGAALGFGDEIEASVRAMSPNVTYEEAINKIRASISGAKEAFPIQAAAWEVGGALIPGLAAAPFTGGGSLIPTLGRAAAIGAAEGGIYGLGTGEGAEGRIKEGLKGAATGAVINPAVQKTFQAVTGGARGLTAYLKNKFGDKLAKPVEDEVMRIVEASGLSVDEILARIDGGEIFPDMSGTVLEELRGYAAQGGKGRTVIEDTVRKRSERIRDEAVLDLQSGLVPSVPEGNITMAFNKNVDELKKLEGQAYKDLFSAPENNQVISPNNLLSGPNTSPAVIQKAQVAQQLSAVSEELLRDFPFLRTKVNAIFKAKKMPLPFEVNDGVLSLTRPLDLETVEIMRRALAENADKLFKAKDTTLSIARGDREKELRSLIDQFSDPLKKTRENWSQIMKTKETFDQGKKALSMKPEELEEMVYKMDPQYLDALRAGFATSIKYKAGAGARQTLIGKLADLRSNERMVLESLYPNESFEQIADKILKSRQAFTTEAGSIKGTQTAFTQQAIKRQGSAGNLADMADIGGSLFTGNLAGATLSASRVVRRSLGKEAESLTEDQIEKIARILVTEDASVFEAAIKNVEGREKLVSRILKLTRMVAGGAGSSAIVASDEAVGDTLANIIEVSPASAGTLPQVDLPDPFGTNNEYLYDQETGQRYGQSSPALESLIQTVKPNVAQKIRQSAQ
jgi:hypothetical protein